jgi:hypothetical protein
VPQSPVPHVCPARHATHEAPPRPHASFAVPPRHEAPSQQPLHDAGSHTHAPRSHRCPSPHAPATHTPPQPSLSPHAFPAQLGVHVPIPHVFGVPAPPQTSGARHPPQSMSVPHARRMPQSPSQTSSFDAHEGAPSVRSAASTPVLASAASGGTAASWLSRASPKSTPRSGPHAAVRPTAAAMGTTDRIAATTPRPQAFVVRFPRVDTLLLRRPKRASLEQDACPASVARLNPRIATPTAGRRARRRARRREGRHDREPRAPPRSAAARPSARTPPIV